MSKMGLTNLIARLLNREDSSESGKLIFDVADYETFLAGTMSRPKVVKAYVSIMDKYGTNSRQVEAFERVVNNLYPSYTPILEGTKEVKITFEEGKLQ